MTAIFTHPACLKHVVGPGMPERPDRLRVIEQVLAEPRFSGLDRREAPQASREQLALIHPLPHIDRIFQAIPKHGIAHLDADTAVCPDSGEAALRAAGAVCAAIDAVMSGEAKQAFCAVRPPGHHAEPERAMGFCLFSNVAIGACHARQQHGLKRIAVVDFDVHHGNGTQAAFYDDKDLFYASTHQYPLYPGTGAPSERGTANNIVNAPLPPGTGSDPFRAAYEKTILPELESFKPELLIISAGFDAHEADPLAQLELHDEDFAWITERLVTFARNHCAGRVISSLEGGYDLDALASSVRRHIEALSA